MNLKVLSPSVTNKLKVRTDQAPILTLNILNSTQLIGLKPFS